MAGRLALKMNGALARYLPEQRLFLRSDSETRFIRLRPSTQALAFGGTAIVFGWTIIASAVLLMDSIGSGNVREQAKREQSLYEARLNNLSQQRDSHAAEAATAQDRFNVALAQVSRMQSTLLASEERRRELETGIGVIQNTLRRTMIERDHAQDDAAQMRLTLAGDGAARTPAAQVADLEASVDFLAMALAETAVSRDTVAAEAVAAQAQTQSAILDLRLLQERDDAIFRQLEQAVTVSMEPLDRMFRSVGLVPDDVIGAVRRGYSGQGGPLTPISFSTKGVEPLPEEMRANAILGRLDTMNLYRLAIDKTPFWMPVQGALRMTSGFGYRSDPFGGGSRMHEGIDWAGRSGTPILATADGEVVHAGWQSGYGQSIRLRHAMGIETVYGHLSRIRVLPGQRVSRGDQIGDMGSTGRSTGTHLHYEVRTGGTPVNPMTYIKAARDVF